MGKETTEGPQWRQRRTLLLWNLQQRWRETGKKQARQINFRSQKCRDIKTEW